MLVMINGDSWSADQITFALIFFSFNQRNLCLSLSHVSTFCLSFLAKDEGDYCDKGSPEMLIEREVRKKKKMILREQRLCGCLCFQIRKRGWC